MPESHAIADHFVLMMPVVIETDEITLCMRAFYIFNRDIHIKMYDVMMTPEW
jgi:hypothetical protein